MSIRKRLILNKISENSQISEEKYFLVLSRETCHVINLSIRPQTFFFLIYTYQMISSTGWNTKFQETETQLNGTFFKRFRQKKRKLKDK